MWSKLGFSAITFFMIRDVLVLMGRIKIQALFGARMCDRTECSSIWSMDSKHGAIPLLPGRHFLWGIWDQSKHAKQQQIQMWHMLRLNILIISGCNAYSITLWWLNLNQGENQLRTNGRRQSTWFWQCLRVTASSRYQAHSTYHPMRTAALLPPKGGSHTCSAFLQLCGPLLPTTLHSGSLLND